MTRHLMDEEINDLLDRQLSVGRELDARAHVETCEQCATMVNRISIIIASACELRIAVIPNEDLWEPIVSRIIHARTRRPTSPWVYVSGLAIALAAVLIAWNVVARRPADSRPAVIAAWNANSDGSRRAALLSALPIVARDQRENAWSDFFNVLGTINSDGERRKVLLEATRYASNKSVAIMIIRSAAPMKSTSNMADVLAAVAHADAVRTDEVREVYLKVVATLPRGADRNRATEALTPD